MEEIAGFLNVNQLKTSEQFAVSLLSFSDQGSAIMNNICKPGFYRTLQFNKTYAAFKGVLTKLIHLILSKTSKN